MIQYEKYYNFACVTYASEDQIKRFLHVYRNHIKHYAYALHDKDDNETHTHIILLWHNNCSCSAVKRRFSKFTDQNTMVEPLRDKSACFEYLTHKNDEDKIQYDVSIIKMDNAGYWQSCVYEEETDENKAVAIINDLLNGVPLNYMLKRYGRDFVLNFEKYRQFANMLAYENGEPVHLIDEDGVIYK